MDYAKTTLASQMDMVIDRKLAVVNNVTREASFVIGEDEDYYSDIKTSDGLNRYNLYSDEACLQSISTLNSKTVGNGTVVYAKTTNADGVSAVYKVYVSVGDVNAARACDGRRGEYFRAVPFLRGNGKYAVRHQNSPPPGRTPNMCLQRV